MMQVIDGGATMQLPGWLNTLLGGPNNPPPRDPDLDEMHKRVRALEKRLGAIDALDVEIDVIVRRKPGEVAPVDARVVAGEEHGEVEQAA